MKTEDDQDKRRIDSRHERWYRDELSHLRDNDYLSGEAWTRIVDHYAWRDGKRENMSMILGTLVSLGVLMLAVSAMLLVGFNWKYLAPVWKLAIVIGTTAVVYGGALYARWTRGPIRRFDELLLFAGSLCFGICIWQVSQILNGSIGLTTGLWIWLTVSFALALQSRLPLLHLLSAGIMVCMSAILLAEQLPCALFTGVSAGSSVWRMLFSTLGEWLVLFLPILAIWGYRHGRIAADRRTREAVCLVYLIALVWWLFSFCFSFGLDDDTLVCALWFFATAGAVMTLFALTHESEPAAGFMNAIGGTMVAIALIPQGFYEFNAGICSSSCSCVSPAAIGIVLFEMAVALAMLALWVLRWRLREHVSRAFASAATPLIIVLVGLVMTVCCFCSVAPVEFRVGPTMVYSNIAMIFFAFWMMLRGIERSFRYYCYGVLYFLLWACMRYYDLFGPDGRMVGAAVFFFGIACVLFTGAILWRRFGARTDDGDSDNMCTDNMRTDNMCTDNMCIGNARTDGGDGFPTARPDSEPSRGPVPLAFKSERNRNIAVFVVVFLQFAFLAGHLASQYIPMRGARKITVETAPCDPRDMFRGHYVILRYGFSSVPRVSGVRPESAVPGDRDQGFAVESLSTSGGPEADLGLPVFLTLEEDARDSLCHPVKLSGKRPPGGIYLQGRLGDYNDVVYGIEKFFVQEGSGRKIERAMNDRNKKVLVNLLVSPGGKARVVDVRVTTR